MENYTMLSFLAKMNKAWVAAAVAFVAITGAQFLGFNIDAATQAAIISGVTGVLTWLVPNYQ